MGSDLNALPFIEQRLQIILCYCFYLYTYIHSSHEPPPYYRSNLIHHSSKYTHLLVGTHLHPTVGRYTPSPDYTLYMLTVCT